MADILKTTFFGLAGKYTTDSSLIVVLWASIEKHYTGKGRYYHNLSHLENILGESQACQSAVEDWHTTLFALFYHDLIYKSTAKDNEEKSAEAAVKALRQIGYPEDKITKCETMIIATKSHRISPDNDTNLFLPMPIFRCWAAAGKNTIFIAKTLGRNILFIPTSCTIPVERKSCSIFWIWGIFLKPVFSGESLRKAPVKT